MCVCVCVCVCVPVWCVVCLCMCEYECACARARARVCVCVLLHASTSGGDKPVALLIEWSFSSTQRLCIPQTDGNKTTL